MCDKQTDDNVVVSSLAQRQTYMTDLARDTFDRFAKLFVAICVGAFAALSAKETLSISPDILMGILTGMAVLVTLLGVISVLQIIILLVRWYKYRALEHKLSGTDDLKPEWWAALFEAGYAIAIVCAIVVIWLGKAVFGGMVQPH